MRSRYAVRLLPRLRALAPRIAAEAQRRATGYLNGSVPDFGARRQTLSWANSSHRAIPRSGQERERATRVLESALLQRPSAPADPNPIIGQARPPAASAPDPWRGQPNDLTIPVPATGFSGFTPSSPGASPYSAFGDAGASSNGGAPASSYPPTRLTDQPTGPLATPPATPAGQANRAGMRELPPDLYQLYGDYLNDMEPEAPVRPAPRASAPPPAPPPAPPRPATRQQPPSTPTDANARNDQSIFWQLRYQLEAYVRRAARSYGVPHQGGDPATVLDELRRSGFVDEADLRIAEGVFALTDRRHSAGPRHRAGISPGADASTRSTTAAISTSDLDLPLASREPGRAVAPMLLLWPNATPLTPRASAGCHRALGHRRARAGCAAGLPAVAAPCQRAGRRGLADRAR